MKETTKKAVKKTTAKKAVKKTTVKKAVKKAVKKTTAKGEKGKEVSAESLNDIFSKIDELTLDFARKNKDTKSCENINEQFERVPIFVGKNKETERNIYTGDAYVYKDVLYVIVYDKSEFRYIGRNPYKGLPGTQEIKTLLKHGSFVGNIITDKDSKILDKKTFTCYKCGYSYSSITDEHICFSCRCSEISESITKNKCDWNLIFNPPPFYLQDVEFFELQKKS